MKIKFFALLAVAAMLQACSGSGGSNNSVSEPKEVHGIQPDKVAEYVERFKTLNAQIKLTLDGKESAVEFLDMDDEDKQVYVKFNQGVLIFGFDMDKEQPIASDFTIFKGDTSDIEALLKKPSQVLLHKEMTLTRSGDNFEFDGMLEDKDTTGLFPVKFVLNESLFGAGNASFELSKNKDSVLVSGALGTSSYVKLKQLLDNNPSLKTLVLVNVEGSVNDDINMHTGRLVRNAQMTTEIRDGGEAYSGGVDLFAAGYRRVYHDGAKLGVHSWCCKDGKDAGQLSKNDPAHGAQLTFFREMLGKTLGPDFYFYTIQAAPAAGIHVMTKSEVDKYLLVGQ